MAYGDIPDLIFTVDSEGNVVYSNSSSPQGSSSTNSSNTGTQEKKWWEQLFGIIPGLFSAIFGKTAQAQSQVPVYNYPTGTSNQMNVGNMNIILIAAAIIVFILLRKK